MKARSQPEAQRKQISEHLLKKLMKKLQKYKSNPTAFVENFPLYVVLAVRMHRWDVVVRPQKIVAFTNCGGCYLLSQEASCVYVNVAELYNAIISYLAGVEKNR